MKNKKRLGFLSAILGACITVTSMVGTVAFAEENATNYVAEAVETIAFYEHEVNYFKDGTKTIDLSSKDYSHLEVQVKKDSNVLVDGSGYIYDEGSITYGVAGTYEVTLLNEGVAVSDVATVTVVSHADLDDPVYNLAKLTNNAEKPEETVYDVFNADLQKKVEDVEKDSAKKIVIPDSFWKLFDLHIISKDDLVTSLYVANPGQDFSKKATWTKSVSDIALSGSGTYAFYLEVKDCFDNKIVVDEETMERKADGWHLKEDDTTTPEDETLAVIIPIFTFEYEKVELSNAKINAKTKTGIVGVEYNSGKADVENVSRPEVTLYYNPSTTATATKVSDLTEANGWVIATEEHAKFTTLSTTSLRFTPLKTGAFVYRITAISTIIGATESSFDNCSSVIVVATEVQEQKLVNVKFRNFVKNNWLSLIFLGIALLCVVGIIILAFYKPKDAEEVKAKKVAKKEAVEDVEEAPEVEEPVEEAEEAPAEDVVEEAPVEEAPAEDVEEAPVEETPAEAVVEETPAEEVAPVEEVPVEEVKPEGENA